MHECVTSPSVATYRILSAIYSHRQEAVLVQRENQSVQAAPGQAERGAGPAGQPAAVPPGCHLQAGQAVGAAPRRLLPPRQEFLPR